MENRKVLFYINAINGGGAERVMVNLSSSFVQYGYNVIFVTSYFDQWEYPLEASVKRISLEKTEIVQSRLKKNFTRISKLRFICKKERPDVVISFMAEPNYRALIATLGLHIKNIISVRNDPKREYKGWIGKLLAKYLLPVADGCVFQTEEAQGGFPRRLQNKSTIIFNSVKDDFYRVHHAPLCGRIVTCGRLEEQKNHKMLIKSFALIADKYPEVQLLIYGEGRLREELIKFISEEGLSQHVKLMGTSDDIPTVLREAEIFVLSSDYEGMPNALMEALAVGVPCVSTDCPCGGPHVLIEHGINGLLVPVGDEKKMAEAMDRLLRNKEYAEILGSKARERACAYRADYVFEKWRNYVERVIEK
jgi:glycosyltransferase involved in cell wall biosynthesis